MLSHWRSCPSARGGCEAEFWFVDRILFPLFVSQRIIRFVWLRKKCSVGSEYILFLFCVFFCKFLRKMVLSKCRCAFRVLDPGFFPYTFSHKLLLVRCRCPFDCANLRKAGVPILERGIFPVNSRVNMLLWHVHVAFDCAGSHKVCGAGFSGSWAPAFFLSLIAKTCSCDALSVQSCGFALLWIL